MHELRGEIKTNKNFHEVEPHFKIPPKLVWIETFHRNYIHFNIVSNPLFQRAIYGKKILYNWNPTKISMFFLHIKEALLISS